MPSIATGEFGGVTVIDSKVVAGVTINVADPDLLTSIVDVALIVAVPADLPVATPVDAASAPVAKTVATPTVALHDTWLLGITALVLSE